MASIGPYLRDVIVNDVALSALINMRVYPVVKPQLTDFPAIVYTTQSDPADACKGEPAGTDKVAVQFHIWSADYDQAHAIEEALRTALDCVLGTAGGVTVTGAQYINSLDGIEENLEYFFVQANYSFRVRRT